jgi:hypothetical protein
MMITSVCCGPFTLHRGGHWCLLQTCALHHGKHECLLWMLHLMLWWSPVSVSAADSLPHIMVVISIRCRYLSCSTVVASVWCRVFTKHHGGHQCLLQTLYLALWRSPVSLADSSPSTIVFASVYCRPFTLNLGGYWCLFYNSLICFYARTMCCLLVAWNLWQYVHYGLWVPQHLSVRDNQNVKMTYIKSFCLGQKI